MVNPPKHRGFFVGSPSLAQVNRPLLCCGRLKRPIAELPEAPGELIAIVDYTILYFIIMGLLNGIHNSG